VIGQEKAFSWPITDEFTPNYTSRFIHETYNLTQTQTVGLENLSGFITD